MQFAYTILYVENVEETLGFYEAAFGMKRKMILEDGVYGELETGATTLSFSALSLMEELGKTPGRPTPKSPTFEIAFVVDDVKAALAQALSAGAELVQDAEDMPWGQTTSYVRDNNGFLVELCSAVSG